MDHHKIQSCYNKVGRQQGIYFVYATVIRSDHSTKEIYVIRRSKHNSFVTSITKVQNFAHVSILQPLPKCKSCLNTVEYVWFLFINNHTYYSIIYNTILHFCHLFHLKYPLKVKQNRKSKLNYKINS